jgi:hypothetical protein
MGDVMQLVNTALKLFLQSLPFGCLFNVCSYGDDHEFMFKNGSVENNDKNLSVALKLIDSFDSDFGCTEIYNPLD